MTSRYVLAMLAALGMATWLHAEANSPVSTQPELLKTLSSDATVEQKADACRQLERVGTADAIPALVGLLSNDPLAHRARAALEKIDDPAVDAALRDAIGKLHGRLLAGVVASIGHRRDAKATEALAELLHNPDAQVASAAAYALGQIASPEAAKSLQESLPGASKEVEPAIRDAQRRIAERAGN